MSTLYKQYNDRVLEVLEAKKIVKTPRTIESALVNLRSSENALSRLQAAKTDSTYAEKAINRHIKTITDSLDALAARDMKSTSEVLKEELLDTAILTKRALIHTAKLQKLAALRKYYAETTKELERQLNVSENKVPFSQRAAFSQLLIDLQSELPNEELANEE